MSLVNTVSPSLTMMQIFSHFTSSHNIRLSPRFTFFYENKKRSEVTLGGRSPCYCRRKLHDTVKMDFFLMNLRYHVYALI